MPAFPFAHGLEKETKLPACLDATTIKRAVARPRQLRKNLNQDGDGNDSSR